MTRPDVHYARNGDVSLAYQVVGEGPEDLMLVSGFLSNIEYAWLYPSLAGFLARLASFSRLILMDRRGSGLSDRISAPPPIETSLEDVEVVLDEVGSPKTTLFGLWDGCVTSILFAATRPERVASLVLFSSSPAQTPKEDYPWAWTESRWAEWLTSIREGWGSRAWIVRNARWMGPTMLDDPAELEHWITYTRLAASPSSAETVMRNSKNTDIRQVLPVVQAPALVLHRKGDQVEAIEAGRYVASRIGGARFVELDGDDGIPWLGDVEALASEIENFLAGRAGADKGSDRRLATVLFTDIVGSTEHLAALGDARWRQRLREHDRIVERAIVRHDGRKIDSAGDGVFATFDGPAAAVRCAQGIIEAVRALGFEIRAGVHTGEVEADGARVRGVAVHLGARIAAEARASQVLVSSTVRDLTAGSGLTFKDAGEHRLKGFEQPWQLYVASTSAK